MSTFPDHEPTFTVRLTAAEAMCLKDAALAYALLAEGNADVIDMFAPPHGDGGTTLNGAHMAERAAERIYRAYIDSPDGRRTTESIALMRLVRDYARGEN